MVGEREGSDDRGRFREEDEVAVGDDNRGELVVGGVDESGLVVAAGSDGVRWSLCGLSGRGGVVGGSDDCSIVTTATSESDKEGAQIDDEDADNADKAGDAEGAEDAGETDVIVSEDGNEADSGNERMGASEVVGSGRNESETGGMGNGADNIFVGVDRETEGNTSKESDAGDAIVSVVNATTAVSADDVAENVTVSGSVRSTVVVVVEEEDAEEEGDKTDRWTFARGRRATAFALALAGTVPVAVVVVVLVVVASPPATSDDEGNGIPTANAGDTARGDTGGRGDGDTGSPATKNGDVPAVVYNSTLADTTPTPPLLLPSCGLTRGARGRIALTRGTLVLAKALELELALALALAQTPALAVPLGVTRGDVPIRGELLSAVLSLL